MADGSIEQFSAPATRQAPVPWTHREEQIVRQHYPAGGFRAVQSHLPRRTAGVIKNKARALGVPGPANKRHAAALYPKDEAIDAKIRALYATPEGVARRGSTRDLAKEVGRPPWWVSQRARTLGVVAVGRYEPDWTPPELEILTTLRDKNPRVVRSALAAAGFRRKLEAIKAKRKVMGIRMVEQRGVYPAKRLAELLGCGENSILRHIGEGRLAATRQSESSHWEITDAALRRLLIRHPNAVDLRLIPPGNRPWFIEVVAGEVPATVIVDAPMVVTRALTPGWFGVAPPPKPVFTPLADRANTAQDWAPPPGRPK